MPVRSKHDAFSSSQLDASFNHISSWETDMHLNHDLCPKMVMSSNNNVS